jgi:phage tail tube protein FII
MSLFPNGTIYQMSAANMYCGSVSSSSNVSLHLQLTDVKLPGFQEHYVDWRPGGSAVGLEIDMYMEKLLCSFACAGWQPQVAELIEAWSAAQNSFNFYGLIRDKFGASSGIPGSDIKATATIRGRLGVADPDNFRRGDLNGWKYAIRSIFAYKLVVGSETVYDWDFTQNTLNVGNTA